MIELSTFKKKKIYQNKNFFIHVSWFLINNLIFNTFFPFNNIKIIILRLYGAKIGKGVILKNYLRIKFPWNLEIGDNVWVGESVWIDNISSVIIKKNCCISQGVYFCTGNHNFKKKTFDLKTGDIVINESSWLGAKTIVSPGSIVKKNSFIKLGSVIK